MAVNAEQNQQYNQEQNANQQQQAPSTGAGAAQTNGNQAPSANTGSRVANYSSGQQAGTTGSGRFTNLSKYINANQGAGDRLGSGIENKVSTQNQGAEKDADTSASAVRQGIQDAQGKLATGDQYKQQVSSDNFNAQDIAGDANKLQDFTNYRTGSAIDEAALAKQNQAAQDSANAYQNQMQTQLNQTQTDNGRYGLLKQAFGGGSVYQNPYSQGQQRLDQLFLQSGGDNKIGQLQNQLRTGINTTGNSINDLTGQVTNDVNDITTNEAAQSKAIQDAITGKTNDFTTGLTNSVADVNTQRAADQQYVKDQYAKLQSGQQIDQKFANMLGLENGQHTFNATQNDVGSYFNLSPAQAATMQDAATQGDVDKYKALAQLSGIDPSSYALTSASTLDPAVNVRNNGGDFRNIVNNYQNQFNGSVGSGSASAGNGGGGFSVGPTGSASLSSNISNIANVLDKYGLKTADAQAVGQAGMQNPQLLADLYSIYGQTPVGSPQTTTSGQAAASQSIIDALNQIGNIGYFNTVNVAPQDNQETGNQFSVR